MAISYIYGGVKSALSDAPTDIGTRVFYFMTGPTGVVLDGDAGREVYAMTCIESLIGITALTIGILALTGVIHLSPGVGTAALIGGSIETGFAILGAAGITLGRLGCPK